MSLFKYCIYNMQVNCKHHAECFRCGWSPEVSRIRREKLQDTVSLCKIEKSSISIGNGRSTK